MVLQKLIRRLTIKKTKNGKESGSNSKKDEKEIEEVNGQISDSQGKRTSKDEISRGNSSKNLKESGEKKLKLIEDDSSTSNNEEEEEIEEDDGEQVGEEIEEEDDDALVGNFEFEERIGKKQDSDQEFACLSPEDIVSQQHKEIQSVADLCNISHSVASALLRHFHWKKERLITAYFEDPEKVRKEAGVASYQSSATPTETDDRTVSPSKAVVLSGQEMCSICGDDVSADKCTALTCMHRFCNDCWRDYLNIKIKEGDVTKIKCPQNKCNLAVDEATIKKLTSPEVYDRFVRFITKSFVEDSDGRVKWCPQPNCGNAITTDMVSGTVVRCTCGYRFCFSCHNEAHEPANCEEVKHWNKKCADDSETNHWKYANCKDCPKCELSVEKNGGCNHMTCFKCKHEWCWVCMRPWKGHNDYYNCNKFMKMEKKPSFFSKKGRSKDKIKEREEEREKNRIALERYLHYYERFLNHSHSRDLEKQIREKASIKMGEMQKEATTSSEVHYVIEGTETLLECRNVLKYTYVFAYYLPESGPKKELFEYLQEDLEKTTEQLSEILETSGIQQMDRLKALNFIQLAATRKNNLIKSVEQGLIDEEK